MSLAEQADPEAVAPSALSGRPLEELIRRLQPLGDSQQVMVQRVDRAISERDRMFKGDEVGYHRVGLSAIACIEAALEHARIGTVQTILNLPCGHGREGRYLAVRFPQAKVTACDIDRDGVEYCSRQFGAIPAYSRQELAQLSLGTQFDLIWCGSLVTHFVHTATLELLRFFYRHLLPGGLLVFTTHGRSVLDRLRGRRRAMGLDQQRVGELLASCQKHGYGFVEYPHLPAWGISVCTPEWVVSHLGEVADWRLVYFADKGWANIQDVYAVVRTGG